MIFEMAKVPIEQVNRLRHVEIVVSNDERISLIIFQRFGTGPIEYNNDIWSYVSYETT